MVNPQTPDANPGQSFATRPCWLSSLDAPDNRKDLLCAIVEGLELIAKARNHRGLARSFSFLVYRSNDPHLDLFHLLVVLEAIFDRFSADWIVRNYSRRSFHFWVKYYPEVLHDKVMLDALDIVRQMYPIEDDDEPECHEQEVRNYWPDFRAVVRAHLGGCP